MTKPFKALIVLWLVILVISVLLFRAFVTQGPAWTEAVANRNPEYHHREGKILMEEGQLAEAETRLRKAVELSPDNPGYWRDLGLCLSWQNRHQDAIPCFEKACEALPAFIERNPQYDANELRARYTMDLARQYMTLGDFSRAVPYAEQSVSLTPPGVLMAEHQQSLCRILLLAEEYGRLAKASAQMLRTSPGAQSHYYRAVALLHSDGDIEEALKSAQIASGAEDARAEYLEILGLIQEKRGEMPAAYKAMQEALTRDSDNPRRLYEAARLARLAGDEPSAEAYLQKLRRMAESDPGSKSLADLLSSSSGIVPATSPVSATESIRSSSEP